MREETHQIYTHTHVYNSTAIVWCAGSHMYTQNLICNYMRLLVPCSTTQRVRTHPVLLEEGSDFVRSLQRPTRTDRETLAVGGERRAQERGEDWDSRSSHNAGHGTVGQAGATDDTHPTHSLTQTPAGRRRTCTPTGRRDRWRQTAGLGRNVRKEHGGETGRGWREDSSPGSKQQDPQRTHTQSAMTHQHTGTLAAAHLAL